MMANYFRDTSQLFDMEPNELEKFDYVLRRHLPFNDARYFGDWRKAFVEGLRSTSGKENGYVAAVFHNVLATYYLNRSTKPSAYQANKLAERQLYLDTNILYALKVAASNYHEVVKYFIDRLSGLNIPIYVFPFTLAEYEKSLALTEQEVRWERRETLTKGYRPALDALSCSRFSGAIHFPERCASATKARALSYSRFWFK